MAEQHGIEVSIDSSQAKAGENRVIRSLENIKKKTAELGQAGVAAGAKAAEGFGRYARGGQQAEKTLDGIKARSRQTANDNVRDAQRAGSAWAQAFAKISGGGRGFGGGGGRGGGGWFDDFRKSAAGASTEVRGLASNMTAASAAGTLIGRAIGLVVGGLTALVSLQAAKAFLDITDAAKRVEAQLRLTIPATMSYAQAQGEIVDLARRTRAPIEDIAVLYGRVARTALEMGKSAESASRATETVAKSLRISGAGAIETASTVRQLTQALQSGVLRGDEFNSMMENSPRLAKLLADSLGVPVGALREMAEEGEITADKLYRALTDKKFTDQLDKEFREIPVTFSDAMTLIRNAAFTTISEFDAGGQFSRMIVDWVTNTSDGFHGVGTSAQNMGIEVRATIDATVATIKDLVNMILDAGGSFGKLGDIVVGIGKELRHAFSGDAFEGLFRALDDMINTFVDIINKIRQIKNEIPGASQAPMLQRSDLAGTYNRTFQNRQQQLQSDAWLRNLNNQLPSGIKLVRTPSGLLMPQQTSAATRTYIAGTPGGGGNKNATEKARTAAQALNDFVAALRSEGLTTLPNPYRTAARQNELFRQGLSPLSGYGPGNISRHQNYQAVDLNRGSFDAATLQKVYAAAQKAGIKGLEPVTESGGRRHLEWTGHGKPGDLTDMLREQTAELERQQKIAQQRQEKENEFWATLQNEAKVAAMLPGEAEKYAAYLDLQLIRADGQLDLIKELSAEEKKRIDQAIDLANKNKLIADMQGAGRDAQMEMTRLLDQQQILSNNYGESLEEQLELEQRMWPYKQRALEQGIDLQDETVRKAFEELAAREKVNIEIARRNRLIEEGNALVDDLLDQVNPFRSVQREYRENLKRLGASTRPQAEKDEALEQLNRDYARQMDEIHARFRMNMLASVAQIADQFEGAFGDILEGLGRMVVLIDQVSKRLIESGQMPASSKFGQVFQGLQSLSNNFAQVFGTGSGAGKFFTGLSKVLGQAAYGAEIGATVNGVMKAIGFNKFSNTGSQIGGAAGNIIGTAIGGPVGGMIGSFLGSVAGGIIGSFFKKTKKASATVTSAYGDFDVTGNSGKREEAATEMGKAVQQGLIGIANSLGAQLGSFAVSIGMRKDTFRVDPTGQGRTKGMQKFETAEEAIAYAILDAIKDGALKGLSAATNRILKNATTGNIDQLLQAAQVYEQLLHAAQAAANPAAGAWTAFITNMKATMEMLKAAGYSYQELALLSDAFAQQQKQILEEMTAGYKAFLKEITTGPSSGKTIFDQFTSALADFRSMVAKGGFTQDEFTSAGQNVIDLARQVYGSATPQFEKIRAELVAATQKAIDQANQAAQDALNSAGIITAIGTTNSILTSILNQLYYQNGVTPPASGTTGGGTGTTTPPSSYSYSGGYTGGGGGGGGLNRGGTMVNAV